MRLDIGRGQTDDVRYLLAKKIEQTFHLNTPRPVEQAERGVGAEMLGKGLQMLESMPEETVLLADSAVGRSGTAHFTVSDHRKGSPASVEDLLDQLARQSDADLYAGVLCHVSTDCGRREDYQDMLHNPQALYGYFQCHTLSEGVKEQLLFMYLNVDHYRRVFYGAYQRTAAVVSQLYREYAPARKQAYAVFEDDAFVLGRMKHLYPEIDEKGTYVVSPCLLNSDLLSIYQVGGGCYLGLGVDFDRAVDKAIYAHDQTAIEVSLNSIGKIFSDSKRCEIVDMLLDKSLCLTQIARNLGLAPNTTLYHLQVMVEAGLLLVENRGKKTVYTVQSRYFSAVAGMVQRYRDSLVRAADQLIQ